MFPDLDLYDDTDIPTADLIEEAQALEAAARSVAGVTTPGGASATCGFGGFVLVTSDGFSGTRALGLFPVGQCDRRRRHRHAAGL